MAGTARVLITGWFSFLDGEATAGDVLAADCVAAALDRAGIAHETAWSETFRGDGPALCRATPARYSHLLFVCGPLHSVPPRDGERSPLLDLHRRFRRLRRIAVGVSVPDPDDPAVTGFDLVLPRDGVGVPVPAPDLSCRAPRNPDLPVLGVILTGGQREYGRLRRHDQVNEAVQDWLGNLPDAAVLPLDTRLDTRQWHLPSRPAQLEALLARLDAVVTCRLHGLVLALRSGVPALAVDPVRGGAKVTAQARALRWPALLAADEAAPRELSARLGWCLSTEGHDRAGAARDLMRGPGPTAGPDPVGTLLAELTGR